MCLACMKLANAFEPDWPDMGPAAARGTAERRLLLFCADAEIASPAPDARAVSEPREAMERS
jgi:hypothetical protein